jgi:hypothetical protein
LAKFVSWLAYTFFPDWRIGCLPDAALPRSADGYSLIERRENTGEIEVGWCCGSADEKVIPAWIREKYPRITNSDHQNEFPKYKRIITHGGAGTEDMKGMCGVRRLSADVMDKDLDRDYIYSEISSELHQNRSPLPFVGMLIMAGFSLDIGWGLWILACLFYIYMRLGLLCVKGFSIVARVYLILLYCYSWMVPIILCVLSVPYLARASLLPKVRNRWLIGARFVIQFPILVIWRTKLAVVLTFLALTDTIPKIVMEINNWSKKRTSLIIRKTHGFPLPFGHLTLRDNVSGRQFEGRFSDLEGFGEQFGWISNTVLGTESRLGPSSSPLMMMSISSVLSGLATLATVQTVAGSVLCLPLAIALWGATVFTVFEPVLLKEGGRQRQEIEIPLPFNPDQLEEQIAKMEMLGESLGRYSPFFNCHTIAVQHLFDHAVIGWLPLVLMALLSLFVIVPGWLAAWLSKVLKLKIFGFDLAHHFNRQQMQAAFAAAPSVSYVDADVETEVSDEQDEINMEAVATFIHVLSDLAQRQEEDEEGAGLTEAEAEHVKYMTMKEFLTKHEIRAPPTTLPDNVWDAANPNCNWRTRFWHYLTRALDPCKQIPYLAPFLAWVGGLGTKIAERWYLVYAILSHLGEIVFEISIHLWRVLRIAVETFLDAVAPGPMAPRLKNVWALTGLGKTPYISARRRLEEETVFMEHKTRPDFLTAFESMVSEINKANLARGAATIEVVPQYRPIRWDKPVLTHEQAALLGFKKGEYVSDPQHEARVASFRAQGAPISADVVYKTPDPDFLKQSVSRYVPKYDPLSAEDRHVAEEIANALADTFPSSHQNMQVSTLKEVEAYYKAKYAAGSPYISLFKSREALARAGFIDALFDIIDQRFHNGSYPDMLFKAFLKAQVVNIEKVFRSFKPGRTVTAEELLSYFMNMTMELERNKRHNWLETGLGIGMQMNQNMYKLFEQINKARIGGAIFANADAHEYDSRTRPFTYAALGQLAVRGFATHPNGHNLASVLQAKYDAMQNAFIFMETTPNYNNSLTVIIEDDATRAAVLRALPLNTITPYMLLSAFPDYKHERSKFDLSHPVHQMYKDKIIVARSIEDVGHHESQEMRRFRTWYQSPIYMNIDTTELSHWDDSNSHRFCGSKQEAIDFLREVSGKIHLCYNVVEKNRGGGTGENATSWDNSWGYKTAFIAAWMKYHHFKYSALDFFRLGNILYNTGDDSAIALKLMDETTKTFDRIRFRECAAYYGIDLDLEFVDSLLDIEYLGKSVRRPNRQDRKELDAWQAIEVRKQLQKKIVPAPPPIPRRIVYQRTRESYIRQSTNRYYQNAAKGREWLMHNMQKQAGTANIAVFNRVLWYSLANDYIEDATRVGKMYGVTVQGKIRMDQFDLPQIHLQYGQDRCRPKRELVGNLSKLEQFHVFVTQNAKFPSYQRSLGIALKPDEHPSDEHQRFLYKLRAKAYRPMEAANFLVDVLQENIGNIPRCIHKMQPNFLSAYPDDPWQCENFYLEKFIYNAKQPETREALASLVQRSPYSSVANAGAFWDKMSDPEFAKEVTTEGGATREENVRVFANIMVLCTLLYAFSYRLELILATIPIVGLLYKFMLFTVIDVPKLYSILNLIYWHCKAESSPTISAIMPKDPYIWMKRVATSFVDAAPKQPLILFAKCLPFYTILQYALWGAVYLSRLLVAAEETLTARGKDAVPFHNPWLDLLNNQNGRLPRAIMQQKPIILTAETGTGKSSLFPYAILSSAPGVPILKQRINDGARIIIAFPRKVLVRQWNSPFDTGHYPMQRLRRGEVINPGSRILLGTSGHILNRINAKELGDEIFLIDEFHECGGETLALLETIMMSRPKCPPFLLSATPKALPFTETITVDAGLPARFKRSIYTRDDSPTNLYLYAKEQWPEKAKHGMIKVTTFREQDEVIDALEYNNIKCHRLNSITANDPIPQDAVLVATDIINAGISIPGRQLLVSNGHHMVNHQGQLSYEPTDANTEHQIASRVGRYGHGDVVIRPTAAGTGRLTKQYPSLHYFSYAYNAAYHDLPQLVRPAADPTRVAFPELDYVTYGRLPANVQESVRLLVLLVANGIESRNMRSMYGKIASGKLPEELEHLQGFINRYKDKLQPYDIAYSYALQEDMVWWHISKRKGALPPTAPTGKDPGETLHIASLYLKAVSGRYVSFHDPSVQLKAATLIESPKEKFDQYIASLQARNAELAGAFDVFFGQMYNLSRQKKQELRSLVHQMTLIETHAHVPRDGLLRNMGLRTLPANVELLLDNGIYHYIQDSVMTKSRIPPKPCEICGLINKTHVHNSLSENLQDPFSPQQTNPFIYHFFPKIENGKVGG